MTMLLERDNLTACQIALRGVLRTLPNIFDGTFLQKSPTVFDRLVFSLKGSMFKRALNKLLNASHIFKQQFVPLIACHQDIQILYYT